MFFPACILKTSPNLTHSQFAGISKGASLLSRGMICSGFFDFLPFGWLSALFASEISFNKSAAVPSLLSCCVSFPRMARSRIFWPAIIARLNEINQELGRRSITTARLGDWLKRMNDQISVPRKNYAIPRFEGEAFSDAHGIGDDFRERALTVPLGKGTHGKEMGSFFIAHGRDALLIAFDGPVLEKLTPDKAMGERMGICYDFIHIGVADAAAGPFAHSRNAVMEWRGEEWPAKSFKYGDNYQLIFEIPYATLQAKGMTDFIDSGKLSLYAARITYTVNHFGISPKSIPANATLLQ